MSKLSRRFSALASAVVLGAATFVPTVAFAASPDVTEVTAYREVPTYVMGREVPTWAKGAPDMWREVPTWAKGAPGVSSEGSPSYVMGREVPTWAKGVPDMWREVPSEWVKFGVTTQESVSLESLIAQAIAQLTSALGE